MDKRIENLKNAVYGVLMLNARETLQRNPNEHEFFIEKEHIKEILVFYEKFSDFELGEILALLQKHEDFKELVIKTEFAEYELYDFAIRELQRNIEDSEEISTSKKQNINTILTFLFEDTLMNSKTKLKEEAFKLLEEAASKLNIFTDIEADNLNMLIINGSGNLRKEVVHDLSPSEALFKWINNCDENVIMNREDFLSKLKSLSIFKTILLIRILFFWEDFKHDKKISDVVKSLFILD